MSENYYARLGIPFDASLEEVRKAYREAAKRTHPDANRARKGVTEFLTFQEAFEVLSDPEKRASYDRTLSEAAKSRGLMVETTLSRSVLHASRDPQLVYLLLHLKPIRDRSADSTSPVNVCLVLDRSTSMKGRRIDMVKGTVRRILPQLQSVDYLSVVAFSDRADVIVPATRDPDRGKTEARISMLQAGGGTEIYRGLEAGFQQVLRQTRLSTVNHLILITDGHTYGDEDACLQLAEEFKAHGVTISAIGIGDAWNAPFLDKPAAKTGGTSLYAADAQDIQTFLETRVRDLKRSTVENVTVDLNPLHPDVHLTYAFRAHPDPAHLEGRDLIAVGGLGTEEYASLLLELRVSHVELQEEPFPLLEGEIRCRILSREIPVVREKFITVVPVRKEVVTEPPPKPIMDVISSLALYRMQEQAQQDLANGNVDAATRRLKRLATQVLASGDNLLASRILSEAQRLEGQGKQTIQLDKAVMYGTRSLISRRGRK